MIVKKLKETITLFNGLLSTTEKDECDCLLETITESEKTIFVIKVLKGEDKVGLVSRMESDFEFQSCIVKFSELTEQLKKITSKKDEIEFENKVFDEIPYLQLLKNGEPCGLLNYKIFTKPSSSLIEEIVIAECNMDYWNETFPIQKLISRKSLLKLTNHLFINCKDNKILSVNTDESTIILNGTEAIVFQQQMIVIKHNLLSTFFNWSSKLKGDFITISKKTFPQSCTYVFSCDGYEFIMPKINLESKYDETFFFEKLQNLVLSYDYSLMSSQIIDLFKCDLKESQFKKDVFLDYKDFRFAKKVLNPILEGLPEATLYLPSDNLKPIFLEYEDDGLFQKAMVFPIDKEKQNIEITENSDI